MNMGLAETKHTVTVEEIAYRRYGDRTLMARLYRPSGKGPFPAMIDVHGGAWVGSDRFTNESFVRPLAEAGIAVLSIDFRMPPEAPYPASVADINYAIRWFKAHAAECGTRADRIGTFGSSSGGHQVLLAAMRPADPRYAAIPLPEAPALDARPAFVISAWGVLDPLLRYRLAKERNNAMFVASHDAFWATEAAMADANPPLMLQRGEAVALPPAFVFQAKDDEWVPLATAERFVADWRKAGGEMDFALLESGGHAYYRDDPTSAASLKSIELVRDYVKGRFRD